MKVITGLSLALGLHTGLGVSLLVLPEIFRPGTLAQLRHQLHLPDLKVQTPPFMNPNFPSAGGGGQDGNDDPRTGEQVVSDVVGSHRNINIFAGLMREVDTVYQRISDAGRNSTILAPNNAAMNRLPRKPWEDLADYNALGDNAYQGQSGEDRAHNNLRRFVEGHVIPQSPWPENDKAKTISGSEIWWERKSGKKVIQPGGIEVTSESSTSNGEIWIIESALGQ